MNINQIKTNPQDSPDVSEDLIYFVQNYVVLLQIDELDMQAQINITYNVLSGIKKDGFKRFIIPPDSNGKIETIEVYDDDGLNLYWDYREFIGRDNKHYKEISFQHPGYPQCFLRTKEIKVYNKKNYWE